MSGFKSLPAEPSALKAAVLPSIIAGVFSIVVAVIGVAWGGQASVNNAIDQQRGKIFEAGGIKNGYVTGEVRAFAFGNKEQVRVLRSLGWLECAGQDLDPKDYPELYARIGETWGTSTRGRSFFVPDLRGMFLRGWNNGATADPDAGRRVAPDPKGSGVTGNNVGSYQPDALQTHTHKDKGHTHPIGDFSYRQDFNRGGPIGHLENTPGQKGNTDLGYADLGEPVELQVGSGTVRAGVETRPKNVFVMFCIFTGRPVLETTPDGSTNNH